MTHNHYKRWLLHCLAGLALAVAPATGMVGCSEELDVPAPDPAGNALERGYINVRLKCGPHASRAEEPGITDLNENLIRSVTLCLSPSAGDRTDDDPPSYMQTFTGLDKQSEVMLRVPLTEELVTRLFNEDASNTCRVFVAVNVDPGQAKTVAELRRLAVSLDFDSSRRQKYFTMDGDATVTYDNTGNYAVGEVKVKRSAAKITLALDVDESVEETVGDEILTWTPNFSGMRVMLQQGVKESTLDPEPRPDMDSEVYFNTPADHFYTFKRVTRPEGDPYARYDMEQDIPFYTYPNKWTGTMSERHGTFMMLSIPWSSDGGTTWRTCYYHVPVVKNDIFETVRNISYHINLHVGVLGSFVPEDPLEIEGDYYVADWGTRDIDVDIKDVRYLVVNQSDYVVNNENSTAIPFYTSHETVVTDVKMTFYRYNFSDQGSEFPVQVTMKANTLSAEKGEAVYECDFDNENDVLNLTHILDIWQPYAADGSKVLLTRDVNGNRLKLDNQAALDAVLARIAYFRRENDTEYSRIVYEVTVQHKDVFDGSAGIDKNLYKETVTIHQYPGMYITAVQNYADNLAKPGDANYANGALGNTQISGRWTTGNTYNVISNPEFYKNASFSKPDAWPRASKNDYWLGVNAANWNYSLGLDPDYGNWNPNLYLVTVTALEAGTPYVIGDPRSFNINNFLSNENVDAENLTNWNGDYYYWQKANGKGPESSTFFGSGAKNPMNRRFIGWNADYWETYEVPGFGTHPAVEGGSRTLRYYYPTREDKSNENMIAPKFRICSSYGGSSAFMTRVMSRRRAAAYQELGYYAGRWRLPTLAEVRYMINLGLQEKIPRLFGSTNNVAWIYWCAQGGVRVPGRTSADQTTVEIDPYPLTGGSGTYTGSDLFTGDNYRDHTRFVYDEWYWGEGTLAPSPVGATPNSTAPIYPFTWGDRLKSNPHD